MGTASAAAGMAGSLSSTGMRALLKAATEIGAMAVNTAMHLKALTDRPRPDGSEQPLKSAMGSVVGRQVKASPV